MISSHIALALRDLRGMGSRLILFVICLLLGVTMIATVGLLLQAVEQGIRSNARELLGGDAEIQQVHRPLTTEQLQWLEQQGKVSASMQMRTMLNRQGEQFLLVELRGVDEAYPLYGTLELEPAVQKPFDLQNGRYGIAASKEALGSLGAAVGDVVKIGTQEYDIRTIIKKEPDNVASQFSLGPRVMTSVEGVQASGLIVPGSMVNYHYDIRINDSAEAFLKNIKQTYPKADWRLRSYKNAASGLDRVISRLQIFLSLAGLTALLTGGLGISHACIYYLQSKRRTLAILKCLGAKRWETQFIYGFQLLLITTATLLAALALAVALEWLILYLFSYLLPVPAVFGVYGRPLLVALMMGYAVTALFAWPALQQTAEVKPASLLRGNDHVEYRLPRTPETWAFSGLMLLVIYFLSIAMTQDDRLTNWFAIGSAGAFLLLGTLGWLVKQLLGRMKNIPARWRLAITNLTRPGAPTTGMMLALGLGLSLLVGLLLVAQNFETRIDAGLPEEAPAFFMLDIQPTQLEPLKTLLAGLQGTGEIETTPMLRGRVSQINGVEAKKAKIAPEVSWSVRNERGITYMAKPGPHMEIVKGEWWPEDYKGKPLISMDAEVAEGYGVGIGDTISVTVVGNEVTGTIANLRQIDWGSLQMNFVFVFSPGIMNDLPQMHLATLMAEPDAETTVLREVARSFPNISIIRVRDTVAELGRLLTSISQVVMATAFVTLITGFCVVAGAIIATSRRRIYDNTVLKVLGAGRRTLLRIYGFEFLLIGVITSIAALFIGTAMAAGVFQLMEFVKFEFLPTQVALLLGCCLIAVVGLGLSIVAHTLQVRPLTVLRNE